jgi:hypothetical protein
LHVPLSGSRRSRISSRGFQSRVQKTGRTTIAFGLTRGETAKAYESRSYVVTVRS